MDGNDIKKIVKLIEETDFTNFEYKSGEMSIKIERAGISQKIKEKSKNINSNIEAEKTTEESIEDGEFKYIKSPMVGTFHNSLDEGEKPLISKGSRIKEGDVIGIIEAMKLMNEVQSDYEGEVVEIYSKDKDVIGYGDKILKLKVK